MLHLNRRLSVRSLVILAGAIVAALGLAGTASAKARHGSATTRAALAPGRPAVSSDPGGPFRFFASTSFWNRPVPALAGLDPSSRAMVGALAAEVASEQQAKTGPWINTKSYSVPIYTVAADQPTVSVRLDHAPDAALSAAWSEVPLPADAQPAAGSDGDLVVWQPSSDRLWEFWKLVHREDGWHASWGGAMQNVSSARGVYGSQAWPGAKPWWGVSACSLSLVGGLITLEDLQRGEINHALSLAVPDVRAGVYASPARRTDGGSADPLSLPEGAHLRLNPSLDIAALHLPRLTAMLARAAQRYGIFVIDGSANLTFYAQDPTPTGSNPYIGPGGFFEGSYPRELLASFPWSQLQVLKLRLHARS